jgi:hypothetical protein
MEVGNPLNVSVIFENKGKTPAHKVRTCQVTRLIKRGEGTVITYPEKRYSQGFSNIMPDGHTLRLGNAVGSDNDPRITQDGLLTHELREAIYANDVSPVTYGQIQYEDIFGVPHWTTFCFNMQVLPPVQGIGKQPAWATTSVGNDMDKNQEQAAAEDLAPKTPVWEWIKAGWKRLEKRLEGIPDEEPD